MIAESWLLRRGRPVSAEKFSSPINLDYRFTGKYSHC